MLEHQLAVGKTYRFTFKPEFERHGVCSSANVTCLHPGNGIFTLKQIASYGDVIASGVDLFSNFFKPIGIKEDEYRMYMSGKPADAYEKEYELQTTYSTTTEEDTITVPGDGNTNVAKNVNRTTVVVKHNVVESGKSKLKKEYAANLAYASYPIYKLVDVTNPDDILWAPEKSFQGFPEVDLINYKNIRLDLNIGWWFDPQTLTPMLQAVRERMMTYGVPPMSIQLFATGDTWMTRDEYDTLKTVRVPGKEVVITDDNLSLYDGKKILVNGSVEFIGHRYFVTKDAVRDGSKTYYIQGDDGKFTVYNGAFEEGGVYYEAVPGYTGIEDLCKKSNVAIDNSLFLTTLNKDADKTFVANQKYYMPLGNHMYKQLIEGKDWAPGDPIPYYKLTSDTTKKSGKTYYKKDSGGSYSEIPVQTNLSMATTLINLPDPVTVYVREQEWRSCDESMTVDLTKRYFRKLAEDRYVELPAAEITALAEDIYVVITDELVPVEPIREDGQSARIPDNLLSRQFYTKESEKYVELGANEAIVPGSTYERSVVGALNYSTARALAMVGQTFEYTDKMQSKITKELNSTDLIMISTEKHDGIRIRGAFAAEKYRGRWFEYTATSDSSVVHQGDRIAVIVGDDNVDIIDSVVGTVYGEVGDLWRPVVIADDSLMERNYFKLYQDEVIKNSTCVAKIEALERVILKLQNDLDTYHQQGGN